MGHPDMDVHFLKMELTPPSLAAPVNEDSSISDINTAPNHSSHLIPEPNTPEAGMPHLAQVSDLKLAVETLNRNELNATLQELTDRQLQDFIFERATLVPYDQHSIQLRSKMMAKLKRPYAAKTFKIEAFTDQCIEKLTVWSNTPLDDEVRDFFANVWFIQHIAVDVDRLGIHGCTSQKWTVKRKVVMAIHNIASSVMALPFLADGTAANLLRHDPFSRAVCLIRQSSEDMGGEGKLLVEDVVKSFDILIERANLVGNFQGLQSALYGQPIPEVIGYGEPYTEMPYTVKKYKKNDGNETSPSHKRQRIAIDGVTNETPFDLDPSSQFPPMSYLPYPPAPSADSAVHLEAYVPPAHMDHGAPFSPGYLAWAAPSPDAQSPCFLNQDQPDLEQATLEQESFFDMYLNSNDNIDCNLRSEFYCFGHSQSSDESQESRDAQFNIEQPVDWEEEQPPWEVYLAEVPDHDDIFKDVDDGIFDLDDLTRSQE